MNKVTEIFKAWKIAYDPDDRQAELASARIKICDGCENKSLVPIAHCTLCGCALKGKIHTPRKNGCPAGKWNEVDNKFLK